MLRLKSLWNKQLKVSTTVLISSLSFGARSIARCCSFRMPVPIGSKISRCDDNRYFFEALARLTMTTRQITGNPLSKLSKSFHPLDFVVQRKS